MAFQSRKKEEGSASLTGLAALFAVGLTSLYVTQNQQKVNDSMMHARVKATADSASLTNMNAVAQFKALVNNGKVGAEYLPALFPQNYWLADWGQITKNPSIPTDDVAFDSDRWIKMSLVDSGDASGKPLENIFKGTQSQTSLKPQDGFIRIAKANFNRSPNYDYVESVDVEVKTTKVEKGQSRLVSSMARIPVPVPQPYNPILQVSVAGANNWSTDFSNISMAEYDLRVIASGVVYKAVIYVNGDPIELNVFDHEGKPTKHAATNVLAKDVVIGTASYQFLDLSVNTKNCKMEPADGQFTIRAVLYNAKGEVSESPSHEVSTTFTAARVTDAGNLLTDDEFKAACSDKCPYYENSEYKEPTLADLQDGVATDFSRPHELWMRNTQLNLKNVKICENMQPMADSIFEKTGSWPGAWSQLDNEGWDNLEYVYYTIPGCVSSPLFKRGKCGCFADETMITLGDGKTQKRITELNERDRVWNPLTRRSQAIARMTSGPEKVPMFDVQIEGKTVRVTGTHPFPTAEGPKPAFELQEGDRVRTEKGTMGLIQRIALVPAGDKAPTVWNLELEAGEDLRDHYVLANGIVTGDLYIQTRLQNNAAGTYRWVSKK